MPGFFSRRKDNAVEPADQGVLDAMRQGGEQLATVPRDTTHYLFFRNQQAVEAAAGQIVGLGYRVGIGDRGGEWVLEVVSTILLNDEAITAARRQLTPIAETVGGRYDGWDADTDYAMARKQQN